MVINKEQADFIKTEFDLDIPAGRENPVSKKLWELVRIGSFMVEGDETRKDGAVTNRCRVAMSICNMEY